MHILRSSFTTYSFTLSRNSVFGWGNKHRKNDNGMTKQSLMNEVQVNLANLRTYTQKKREMSCGSIVWYHKHFQALAKIIRFSKLVRITFLLSFITEKFYIVPAVWRLNVSLAHCVLMSAHFLPVDLFFSWFFFTSIIIVITSTTIFFFSPESQYGFLKQKLTDIVLFSFIGRYEYPRYKIEVAI